MQAQLGSPCPIVITARHLEKRGTQFKILGASLPQSVQPVSHFFGFVSGQGLGAGIDLDAGNDPVIVQVRCKGRTVQGFLTDGFVEQDGAADIIGKPGCGHQHVAVRLTHRLRRGDAKLFEALVAGGMAFIHGKNSPSGCHHGACDLVEFIYVHGFLLKLVVQYGNRQEY